MNLAKLYAQILGIVLLLVGIVGFFPLGTPDTAAQPQPALDLLGIFAINPLHNMIHIATGVLGIVAGFYGGGAYARIYALVFGVVYALVTVLGFVQMNTLLGLVPINLADNFLHTAIAVTGIAAYFLTTSPRAAMRTA